MSKLQHYDIPGMKYGFRFYRNKDGALTFIGKMRYSVIRRQVKRTSSDVQSIIDSMSKHDRDLIGAPNNYIGDSEIENVAKRFIKRVRGVPVAFLGIYYENEKNVGNVVIGTRSGDVYRRKGYASELVKKAKKWLESDEAKVVLQINTLNWFSLRENASSLALAKKYGFEERDDYRDALGRWGGRYRRK